MKLTRSAFASLALAALFVLSGCQKVADHYIENYLERNGSQLMQKLQGRQRQMEAQQMEAQFEQQKRSPVPIAIEGSPSLGDTAQKS